MMKNVPKLLAARKSTGTNLVPAPSKIEALLPDKVRAELNVKIKANGFGGYRDLASWLQEEGFEISKSAVHSHGQKLQAQIKKIRAATEQADYLRTMFPDDDGAMTDGILRTYTAEIFEYMQDFSLDGTNVDPVKLGRVIKDIAHASISQKKLQNEMRKEMLERGQAAVDSGDWQQTAYDEAKLKFGF